MIRKYLVLCLMVLALAACGASKSNDMQDRDHNESIKNQNRAAISLLDQIRQLQGVTLRNGVPVITKATNTIYDSGSFEPLYILDEYIVGNSFRDVDQLVNQANIENIVTITGPDASFYGSRGSNGIIKITTIQK